MTRSRIVTEALVPGAIAGLVGGLAFGAAMIELGLLETIAALVRTESDVLGFIIHMAVAAVIGAGFGAFVRSQRPEPGGILSWGLVYGGLWWFIGAVTLLPLLSGEPIAWDVDAARQLLPALIGHLVYGIVVALVLLVARRDRTAATADGWSFARGIAAGLIGALLLGWALDAQQGVAAVSASMSSRSGLAAWVVTLAVGILAGIGYAALNPTVAGSLGPSLIKGLAYGFAWWTAAGLTLIPLIAGDGLRWSIDDVRAGFATFPGYLLLLGATLAFVYHSLTAIGRGLFSDNVSHRADEGVGTQGLRATGRGVVAGLAGGLVFTIVMVQIGFLSTVASLVRLESTIVGLLVHLVVATIIGIGYGLLFVRCSNDPGSSVGWGIAYGALWWLLGPLTLLPLILGDSPQWTVDAATDAYPALIGHLAYGALLGVVNYRLEARRNPWWVSRSDAESIRIDRATDQLLGSAPGLWALTALIALTIPVLLGG